VLAAGLFPDCSCPYLVFFHKATVIFLLSWFLLDPQESFSCPFVLLNAPPPPAQGSFESSIAAAELFPAFKLGFVVISFTFPGLFRLAFPPRDVTIQCTHYSLPLLTLLLGAFTIGSSVSSHLAVSR